MHAVVKWAGMYFLATNVAMLSELVGHKKDMATFPPPSSNVI